MTVQKQDRYIIYIYSVSVLLTLLLFMSAQAQDIAGATEADAVAEEDTKRITMRFVDASLDHVLDFFATTTGYTIIKDAELSTRVTVMSSKPLTVDEALSVLNSILAVKGYAGIVNGHTVKIVSVESAKQAPVPIRSGADPETIPAEDTIVTQVMPLTYTDATQIVKDLADLIPEYGLMTAHARTNTLIITAPSSSIRRIALIVQHLDFSMSDRMKVEVFGLQFADASELAQVITELYEKPRDSATAAEQQRNQRGRFFPGFQGRGGRDGGPGGQGDTGNTDTASAGESILEQLGEVKAVADENTNSLIVSASAQNIEVIRGLLLELDRQTVAQPETRIFGLNYADATELANELNQAFSSTARNTFQSGFGGRGGGFSGRGGPGGQQQQQQGNTDGEGVLGLPELVAVPDTRTNSVIVTTTAVQMEAVRNLIEQLDLDIADFSEDTRVFSMEYADASNVASVLNELLSTELFEQQRATRGGATGGGGTFTGRFSNAQGGALGSGGQTAEDAQSLAGNVKIVADPTTNLLLITTFKRNFPVVETLINELDILLPQVLIEAQIIEVTLDDESLFGVEWMWEKDGLKVGDTEYSRDASTDYGLSGETFGLKYGMLSTNLEALLVSLTKDTSVNILSTPRIMTQNNEEAIINIGQEIPFLQSTQETANGGVLTSYDFQDVGVILTVTPRINRSGTVSLDVDQQINSLIEFTLFNAPVIAKREASAYVTVQDGQTVIIGGIIKDDKTQTVHKIPILGDIPFIGKLFQRSDTRTEKTELMVFITPHVVFTDEDARRVTEEQKALLKINNRLPAEKK